MDALRVLSSAGDNYEEIEKLLSCPICLEVYSKPVVILPCQHNLCRKCANDVFQNRGTPMGSGGRFRCPTCRYEVVLDRHGVYGLQRNLLVENIIDMYQTESRKPSFKQTEVLMCDEHEEEKVNIYCTTCQKPTCSLCKVFGEHQDCEVAPMDKIYKDQKCELSDSIALLVSGNDRLQAIISQTEELGKMTESNGRKAKSDLCAAFDKLYAVLEDRKNCLMAKITSDVQERNQVLEEMLRTHGEKLEGASKLMESSLALLEERSVPCFLSHARSTITQITTTTRASDVRKPMFSIKDMDEFAVDFSSYENELGLLNFKDVNKNSEVRHSSDSETADGTKEQDNDATVRSGETSHGLSDDENDENVIQDEEAVDSDDTAATSVTSRSDVGSSYSGRRASEDGFGRSHSPTAQRGGYSRSLTSNPDGQRSISEEWHFPVLRRSRWYDIYVRQPPLLDDSTDNDEKQKFQLEKKYVLDPADASDCEVNRLHPADLGQDLEMNGNRLVDASAEKEPRITRHKSVASLSLQQISPLGSGDCADPACDDQHRQLDNYSTSGSRASISQYLTQDDEFPTLNHLSDSSPQRSKRRSFARDSPPRRRRSLVSDSPTRQSFCADGESPVQGRRYISGDSSTSGQLHANADSPPSRRRRPRQYVTHRRRTWSHLLNKKP